MLLHCLGTEGQRIFHTLQLNAEDVENDNEYETALQVLDGHFQPKLNVVAERYKFRKRSQLPGESVDDYIRELRALASTCNFHDMTDEMIRDQFVERTNSTQIRERLLLEPTLTLADAITISRQVESATRESQIIGENSSHMPQAEVHAVTRRKPHRNKYKARQRYNNATDQPQPSTSSPTHPQLQCYRCGDKSHKANDPNCKAKNASCSKCGKTGHYARVCRSGQRYRSTRNSVHGVFADNENDGTSENDENDGTSAHGISNVLTIQHISHADSIKCSVTMGTSVPLTMIVDTGAALSIIPASIFQKLMSCALSGLNGVQCYLDDVVISSHNQKDHDANLYAALKRLTELGVTLNYDKCHFNMQTLHFLGHTVSSEGLTPDPKHVEALLNAPIPTDPTTL